MHVPDLPDTQNVLAFVADLQANDWKLLAALRSAQERNPQLGPVKAIGLLAAFAALTGQEKAMDVYGVNDDDEAPVGALYGVAYGFTGRTPLRTDQVLLPETRVAYLEGTKDLLPENVCPWRMHDVFSALLDDGRYEDAGTLSQSIFGDA